MNSRRLLILGIAAILAIVAGIWLANRQGSSGATAGTGPLYPGLKEQLDTVNAIRLYKAGDARVVDLTRKDDAWQVSDRNSYPADDGKVRKLLIAISDAKIAEEKTSNPQQYATLGVEDTKGTGAASVRIQLVGPPKPVDLIIGKEAVGGRANYVRRAGETQSWLIDKTLDTSATPDAWLRKDIIDVSADRMQSATVTAKDGKPYTAAKGTRADQNFAVTGLPKGKALSAPTAANSFAMALTALSLSDVKPASAFQSTQPAAHATFKTFDGLVVDVDGWVQAEKHYIALRPAFDAAQAERFKVATAPPEQKKDDKKDAKQDAAAAPTPPPAPDIAGDAKKAADKVTGWVYEIPDYKYESLFKPVDQLVSSKQSG